ncbi:MAG: anaerobic selenocysteine-containing dehydrogenase, partial [Myxococcota bacterium]
MSIKSFLQSMLGIARPVVSGTEATNAAGVAMPTFAEADAVPSSELLTVRHPDGRMSQYPPSSRWDDWVEWDSRSWPTKVARRYTLVPTICFNCESGCGLLAYVDKTTFEIRRFEGNPAHPGSRGRNCAKGPATH